MEPDPTNMRDRIAESATDPGGDLHRQTVEHLGQAWPDLTEDPVYLDQLAHEALSVRWEHAVRLAAELERLTKGVDDAAWHLNQQVKQGLAQQRRAEQAEAEVKRLRKALGDGRKRARASRQAQQDRADQAGKTIARTRRLLECALTLRANGRHWDRAWQRWDLETERFLRAADPAPGGDGQRPAPGAELAQDGRTPEITEPGATHGDHTNAEGD